MTIPKSRKNIIPQMFDVRPIDRSGSLDWEKIGSVGSLRNTSSVTVNTDPISAPDIDTYPESVVGESVPVRRIITSSRIYRPFFHADIDQHPVRTTQEISEEAWDTISDEHVNRFSSLTSESWAEPGQEEKPSFFSVTKEKLSRRLSAVRNTFQDVRFPVLNTARFHFDSVLISELFVRRASIVFLAVLVFGSGAFGMYRLTVIKGEVLGASIEGASLASRAMSDLTSANFSGSSKNFSDAYKTFSKASDSLGIVGNELAKAARFVPGLSSVSSDQGLLEGAKHLSAAGVAMSGVLELLPASPTDAVKTGKISFLDLIDQAERGSSTAAGEVSAAKVAFDRVRPEDVPEDKRATFLSIREKLPVISAALDGFNGNSHLVRELLGANGPRLYLFLFQNNAELRPTGGFIGSYGLLKVDNGHVGKLFVDGIFNPDGQLKENIVPPAPIQKVSAGWSLHDSNWWPDFPTSAEKAMFFYEKTGGPTVDGVVTLTPNVIRDMLKLTGPIDMQDYGVTIDTDNFSQVIQSEVEEKYDHTLNQPKKILSDLAPILLERLFSTRSASSVVSVVTTFSQALNEKDILLYSRNADVEKLVDQAGWSGRMLETPRDYLSVVHTNLNGYKTDAVIKETIEHQAVVQSDGSVLDTVRITRKHTGGNTPYDWFNKVNSDYMRVYVPKGSELVSASGQTYEFPKAPLDYAALGFKRDDDVMKEESTTTVDPGGTRISEETGKTVFGNWVYVSPGESVTVEYTYKLPFKVSPQPATPASYSVLFQKQSGSPGSVLHSQFSFPNRFNTDWNSDGLKRNQQGFSFDATLSTDAYYGAVLSMK